MASISFLIHTKETRNANFLIHTKRTRNLGHYSWYECERPAISKYENNYIKSEWKYSRDEEESPIHVTTYIITYLIIHNHSCSRNPHLTLSLLHLEPIIPQPTYGFSFFYYYPLFFTGYMTRSKDWILLSNVRVSK